MRVVLDACVLFPTVMRRMLLRAATEDAIVPLWSERILEEWARADERRGASLVRNEIAWLKASWPDAMVAQRSGERIVLPDPDDEHVLQTAIAGNAGFIVTRNAGDFPQKVLARVGVSRLDPDAMITTFAQTDPNPYLKEIALMLAELSGQGKAMTPRAILKRAGLPRLGKVLDTKVGQS